MENWQKETLAFMAYADSNDFSIAANLHGGAEVLNYLSIPTSNSQSHAGEIGLSQFATIY